MKSKKAIVASTLSLLFLFGMPSRADIEEGSSTLHFSEGNAYFTADHKIEGVKVWFAVGGSLQTIQDEFKNFYRDNVNNPAQLLKAFSFLSSLSVGEMTVAHPILVDAAYLLNGLSRADMPSSQEMNVNDIVLSDAVLRELQGELLEMLASETKPTEATRWFLINLVSHGLDVTVRLEAALGIRSLLSLEVGQAVQPRWFIPRERELTIKDLIIATYSLGVIDTLEVEQLFTNKGPSVDAFERMVNLALEFRTEEGKPIWSARVEMAHLLLGFIGDGVTFSNRPPEVIGKKLSLLGLLPVEHVHESTFRRYLRHPEPAVQAGAIRALLGIVTNPLWQHNKVVKKAIIADVVGFALGARLPEVVTAAVEYLPKLGTFALKQNTSEMLLEIAAEYAKGDGLEAGSTKADLALLKFLPTLVKQDVLTHGEGMDVVEYLRAKNVKVGEGFIPMGPGPLAGEAIEAKYAINGTFVDFNDIVKAGQTTPGRTSIRQFRLVGPLANVPRERVRKVATKIGKWFK